MYKSFKTPYTYTVPFCILFRSPPVTYIVESCGAGRQNGIYRDFLAWNQNQVIHPCRYTLPSHTVQLVHFTGITTVQTARTLEINIINCLCILDNVVFYTQALHNDQMLTGMECYNYLCIINVPCLGTNIINHLQRCQKLQCCSKGRCQKHHEGGFLKIAAFVHKVLPPQYIYCKEHIQRVS